MSYLTYSYIECTEFPVGPIFNSYKLRNMYYVGFDKLYFKYKSLSVLLCLGFSMPGSGQKVFRFICLIAFRGLEVVPRRARKAIGPGPDLSLVVSDSSRS